MVSATRLRFMANSPRLVHYAGIGRAGMARNVKTLLIAEFMEEAGLRLLRARDDVEVVLYHPAIAPAEFHKLLQTASGVALSFTPFKRPEVAASPVLEVAARIGVGFDAVDDPGADRTAHPADGGRHRQLDQRRRARRVPDDGGRQAGAGAGPAHARRAVARAPERPAARDGGIDGPGGRLRPHRHPHRAALRGVPHERAGL